MAVVVQDAARLHIEEIYRFSRDRWGADQARTYIAGLLATFDLIATGEIRSRPIPAEYGVDGFLLRYRSHVVYWRPLPPDRIGVVAVLHKQMHQISRLRDALRA